MEWRIPIAVAAALSSGCDCDCDVRMFPRKFGRAYPSKASMNMVAENATPAILAGRDIGACVVGSDGDDGGYDDDLTLFFVVEFGRVALLEMYPSLNEISFSRMKNNIPTNPFLHFFTIAL